MNTETLYLVVDLEATCDEDHAIPREQTEIIEIGAVLVDGRTLQPLRELSVLVRPRLHPITPFCTQLTSITREMVANAPLFPEAIAACARWLGSDKPLLCSWGGYDRDQLRRDASRSGVRLPFGDRHLNLKARFADAMELDREVGVGAALSKVGLRFEGRAHRGIDDARNIARLLPWALGRRAPPKKAPEPPRSDREVMRALLRR